ncbi:MAG: HAD domain-containing protein [Solirubrobacterales bacterium]|nr:HAD domain-containing protein [Solirubrobacterales bacterium]
MGKQLPVLYVDVDGVLSLFDTPKAPPPIRPDTHFLGVGGVGHLIALDNCARLLSLVDDFELVWATGWEERANDELLSVIGLSEPLDVVSFDTAKYDHQAHWKLGALDAHAGDRPLAWIDDALDDACREWATSRSAPTLLVETKSNEGLTDAHAEQLTNWAKQIREQAA